MFQGAFPRSRSLGRRPKVKVITIVPIEQNAKQPLPISNCGLVLEPCQTRIEDTVSQILANLRIGGGLAPVEGVS
jgi:hypothetical protein